MRWTAFSRPFAAAIAAFALPLSRPGQAGAADAPGSGLATTLTACAEAWQNVRGGTATGGWWNTLVDARAELNGVSFGAPRTSSLVGHVHWVTNRHDDVTFSETTGAFTPVSGIMASTHLRVFNLYYRQGAAHERWEFKVGQMAIDDDFMLSAHATLFANAGFGAMPSQVATPRATRDGSGTAYPIYGVAAPGLWGRWMPADTLSWQSGVYHGGPGVDDRSNIGFSWSSLSASGVACFSELTWQPRGGHASTTRLGLSTHLGPVYDYAGMLAGRSDARVHGLVTAYLVEDITLISAPSGAPRLGAFTRVGVGPQRARSAVLCYVDAGLVWTGLCPARPDDVAGIAVSSTRFGDGFRQLNGLATSETALELAYRIRATPRLTVQADVQALFGTSVDRARGTHGSAVVAGVRSSFTF